MKTDHPNTAPRRSIARARAGTLAWLSAALIAASPSVCASADAPAPAQSTPAPSTPGQSTSVSEVVVRPPGPAWWIVSSDNRKAYILASMGSVAFEQVWSTATLEQRLQGADAVVLPPMVAGPTPLKAQVMVTPIPPALAERLKRTAIAVGMPPDRYQGKSALEAGTLLLLDFSRSRGDGRGVVANAVAHKAQELGVPVAYASIIRPSVYEASLGSASEQAGEACLTEALNEVETGPAPFQAAATGWAQGDVRRAASEPRGLELCGAAIPRQEALKKRATSEQVAAIVRALTSDPKTAAKGANVVFVVDLKTLLIRDGVLEQLRALHYQVEAPTVAK